ncbi:YceI family protein [Legionella saoudiensis]|uniref:YceI family protein n=1 Tax=Legionella saoudiensis TaxID=1750561 RepID=UPI000731CB22|nr:YceI family protein [Legionella saoudiensis]
MKKRIAQWGTLFISLITFSAVLQAEPETFTLDNHHTYIAWNIKHLGFSTQTGKWYATGTLVIDKEHPENSKVEADINVADIVTGIPELDKHLKSKLFFDVEQFPKASFVSNKVKVTGENKADVSGVLTLHGISKPVVLHVTFNKVGLNPINNKMTAGFTATAMIKRSDFGINTLLPSLGDEVELNINAEAYQDKKSG